MNHSRAQIVATIGTSSADAQTLKAMMESQLDVIRINFSWGSLDERVGQISLIRQLEIECSRKIPIIVDLPGPRIQETSGHTYNHESVSSITDRDKEFIKFAVEHGVDYLAVSFVGSREDINTCREVIESFGGKQMVIAKIERVAAIENLTQIIETADAVMIARGDLGNEVPLEEIPFIQERIIKECKRLGKPVIVATEMMLSMVDNPTPTRAEVTDVTNAILEGADAVMLSEETAKGKYPVEAVKMMEKILLESEHHQEQRTVFNYLKSIGA